MWPVIGFLVAANTAFHKDDANTPSPNPNSQDFYKIHVIGEGKWLCVAPDKDDNIFPFIVRADSARSARDLSEEACKASSPNNPCDSRCTETENSKTQIEELTSHEKATEKLIIETLHVGDRVLRFEATFLDVAIPKFYKGYATTDMEARALAQQACLVGKIDKSRDSCKFQEPRDKKLNPGEATDRISLPLIEISEPQVKVKLPKGNITTNETRKSKK